METFFIPNEGDFRRWIKEAISEYMVSTFPGAGAIDTLKEEPLISRKDIANRLGISLVTLTDWVKRGLPSHKQRGRVYFLHSEVMDYIRQHPLKRI